MPLEFARLLLGLIAAAYHRQIADFMVERERLLVVVFRERGVPMPAAMRSETARNVYFWIGIFIVAMELMRIFQMLH